MANSIIPMENNARVIAATLTNAGPASWDEGVVLAESGDNEWVTWRVERHFTQPKFTAMWGHYFNSLELAHADYLDRAKDAVNG